MPRQKVEIFQLNILAIAAQMRGKNLQYPLHGSEQKVGVAGSRTPDLIYS